MSRYLVSDGTWRDTWRDLDLSVSFLRRLADALDGLTQVLAGVDSIHLDGYTVHIRGHDSQREGRSFTVVDIVRRTENPAEHDS